MLIWRGTYTNFGIVCRDFVFSMVRVQGNTTTVYACKDIAGRPQTPSWECMREKNGLAPVIHPRHNGGPHENFVADLSLWAWPAIGGWNPEPKQADKGHEANATPPGYYAWGWWQGNAIEPPLHRVVDRLRFRFLESKAAYQVENQGNGFQSA
ncbi:hypothetical protein N7510_009563 [Penicillium lagena]|uniref:uncharacterized protein n=1 Tax=Penicillium lagena TaxID=94218 RepID=UPI002540EE91|nr:uncharacterized protein N7510_009563 [Penicillium lagena]KAJ5604409.1 hypothetical protein N7510_009563 [Penicillium lagena]